MVRTQLHLPALVIFLYLHIYFLSQKKKEEKKALEGNKINGCRPGNYTAHHTIIYKQIQ